MGLAKSMVRHNGEKMMGGMISEAYRRPKSREKQIAWNIDRVHILLGKVHHKVARISITMRSQSSQGIQKKNEQPNQIPEYQHLVG